MKTQTISLNPFSEWAIIERTSSFDAGEVIWAKKSPSAFSKPEKEKQIEGLKFGNRILIVLIDQDSYGNLVGSTLDRDLISTGSKNKRVAYSDFLTLNDTLPKEAIEAANERLIKTFEVSTTLNKNTISSDYYFTWISYTDGLKKNHVLSNEVIDTAIYIVSSLKKLIGNFQLPMAYPINEEDMELRWESDKGTMIVQIDDQKELTLVLRDKVKKKNYGLDCLKIDDFLGINFGSIIDPTLLYLEKK